jgi:DNA-binding transcriptional MerR regulator
VITSAHLIKTTGVSRATLNNYVAQGILPSPDVKRPLPGDGEAHQIGYFPEIAQEILKVVSDLKKEGLSIRRISSVIQQRYPDVFLNGNNQKALGTAPGTASERPSVHAANNGQCPPSGKTNPSASDHW